MRDTVTPAGRFVWVFPGFGVGGAQTRFCALANHLGPDIGHCVLSLNNDLACAEKLAPDLDVIMLPSGHHAGHMVPAILHARRTLRALQPRMVITSNWGAIEWAIGAALAGLPRLHTEDGFGPEERQRQIPRRVLTRRLALRRTEVMLPSSALERIARTQWRLPPARLHYIPNGIDLARFAAAPPMPAPPGEGPVIGTIAALRPEKNIARLIRAVAALRDTRPARLIVVGDGPERPALMALASQLGLTSSTLFAGHCTEPERWLATFDIFALPSDTEQMPLSLLEAMAAGLPTICTDVGDVRDMLSPENTPFVTPPEDAGFAVALAALLAGDTAQIGAANRARATALFGQDAMFIAWRRLLGLPA